jgi:hypothetical protein
MKELEWRAQAIVDAARNADRPTSADRERIRRGLALQIAAGAVAVSTAAVAGTMSLATKVGLIVATAAVVGGGSLGAVKIWKSQQAAHPTTHATRAASAKAPLPAAKPVAVGAETGGEPSPLPVAVPDNAENKPSRSERTRKRAGVAAVEADRPSLEDPLNVEVALLARAREELRLGRPARALEALAEYDRRFGRGALGEERRAIAAIAACQATPGPGARAQAEAFVRSAPSSPLLERVRAACASTSR